MSASASELEVVMSAVTSWFLIHTVLCINEAIRFNVEEDRPQRIQQIIAAAAELARDKGAFPNGIKVEVLKEDIDLGYDGLADLGGPGGVLGGVDGKQQLTTMTASTIAASATGTALVAVGGMTKVLMLSGPVPRAGWVAAGVVILGESLSVSIRECYAVCNTLPVVALLTPQ